MPSALRQRVGLAFVLPSSSPACLLGGELVVGGGGEVGGGEGAGDGDVEGDHGGLAVVGGEEEVDLDASVDGGATE